MLSKIALLIIASKRPCKRHFYGPGPMARSSGTIGASLKNAGWRRFQTRISTDPDSVLEGTGFELPVPRAMQARLEAKITGFGCIRRRLSAAAVGGHQLRRKAKSRNRTLIARGTGGPR